MLCPDPGLYKMGIYIISLLRVFYMCVFYYVLCRKIITVII